MFVQEKVTIVGGGNGGFTAAADLAVKGHRICLFELPQFSKSLDEVKAKGGIDLETLPSSGCQGGFAKLELVTDDAKDAMAFGDIVLVIVPSYGIETMAKALAPYVEDRHIIVLAPPNFGGALFFHKVLMDNGCPVDIPICEFDTMPYAVRKTSPSSVWLRGFKHYLGFSCFPSSKLGDRFERCSHLYQLVLRKNELHTCLNNTNNTLHVGIMLCNVAAIENKEKKLFYRECFSPAAGRLVDAMLRERDSVNRLEGVNVITIEELHRIWYEHQGVHGDTMYEIMHGLEHFQWSPLPDSLGYRYLSEDVPYGLIPLSQFLAQYGLPHHAIDTAIDFSCLITGNDYFANARTLKSCGIEGLSFKEYTDYITYGTY